MALVRSCGPSCTYVKVVDYIWMQYTHTIKQILTWSTTNWHGAFYTQILDSSLRRVYIKSWKAGRKNAFISWDSLDSCNASVVMKAGWTKIHASMLKTELELIVPAFWKEYKNRIGWLKLTKVMLAKPVTSNDTWRTNLGLFLVLIIKISEGRAENTVRTQRCVAQLISEKAVNSFPGKWVLASCKKSPR